MCVTTLGLPSRFCLLIKCPKPDCYNPKPVDPRIKKCCPTCPYHVGLHAPSVAGASSKVNKPPLDCRYIRCEPPECSNPVPPASGECCYRCPPPPDLLTLDCRLLVCPEPKCSNPIPPTKGKCCFTCPQPTQLQPRACQHIRCPMPECSNPIPPAKGECCFTCPSKEHYLLLYSPYSLVCM